MRAVLATVLLLAVVGNAYSACPFARRSLLATPPGPLVNDPYVPQGKIDVAAVSKLDIAAVKKDIQALLTTSQPFWPADVFDGKPNYGGLFIRLAWHNAGTYRKWDGRGGVDGARQRFMPEVAWDDNTNLDKARKLLEPIKKKYGAALSYGDLYVLSGDVAIESMGGPKLGFCAGRIDDANGAASEPLGPTPLQQLMVPCKAGDGMCQQPLGQTTMGLIYVNPAGVMGVPIPEKSAPQIRETFGQMGMNDSETVALIGGGHAFGKTHGACPLGAGPGPDANPTNPWPGLCGSGPMKGKGPNAFTSGFEGSWTSTPTAWSNEYFTNLLDFDWKLTNSSAGHPQWKPANKAGKTGKLPNIMMLTADLALTKDPEYLKWVKFYANDLDALTKAFGAAWYKLMTRDMGPVTRCLGSAVEPAQPFQNPLPPPPKTQPDWAKVKADITAALTKANAAIAPDSAGGKSSYASMFATLAYNCAGTFRATDYQGGCNGAKIRFQPQLGWGINVGVDKLLKVLQPIKAKYPNLTWADLIVLAGTTAVESASGKSLSFCPGRSDATDGSNSEWLAPRTYPSLAVAVRDNMVVLGVTPAEGVALMGRPRSAAQQKLRGYSGSWQTDPTKFDNSYFKLLLDQNWMPAKSAAGKDEFKATVGGKTLYMTPSDLELIKDPQFNALVKAYAADNAKFLDAFGAAWTKVMNADRFKGPTGNVCSA